MEFFLKNFTCKRLRKTFSSELYATSSLRLPPHHRDSIYRKYKRICWWWWSKLRESSTPDKNWPNILVSHGKESIRQKTRTYYRIYLNRRHEVVSDLTIPGIKIQIFTLPFRNLLFSRHHVISAWGLEPIDSHDIPYSVSADNTFGLLSILTLCGFTATNSTDMEIFCEEQSGFELGEALSNLFPETSRIFMNDTKYFFSTSLRMRINNTF